MNFHSLTVLYQFLGTETSDVLYVSFNTRDSQVSFYTPFHFPLESLISKSRDRPGADMGKIPFYYSYFNEIWKYIQSWGGINPSIFKDRVRPVRI